MAVGLPDLRSSLLAFGDQQPPRPDAPVIWIDIQRDQQRLIVLHRVVKPMMRSPSSATIVCGAVPSVLLNV